MAVARHFECLSRPRLGSEVEAAWREPTEGFIDHSELCGLPQGSRRLTKIHFWPHSHEGGRETASRQSVAAGLQMVGMDPGSALGWEWGEQWGQTDELAAGTSLQPFRDLMCSAGLVHHLRILQAAIVLYNRP